MPITIRTRDYGPDFFQAMKEKVGGLVSESAAEMQEEIGELF